MERLTSRSDPIQAPYHRELVIERDGEEVAIPDIAVVIWGGQGRAAVCHYWSADAANFRGYHCSRPLGGNEDLDAEAFALIQKHFPEEINTEYEYYYTCPEHLAALFRERTGR